MRSDMKNFNSMKRFLIVVSSLLLLAGCAGKNEAKDISVLFAVSNPTAEEVVVVYHKNIRMLPLDENGNAEIVLKRLNAVYAKVFYGHESKSVYFEGGDVVKVTFDGKDFMNSFAFEGDKKAAVDYLNKVTLTPLPDSDYALDFDTFHQKIQDKVQSYVDLMKANDLSDAGDFEEVEAGRIKYAYGAMLLMYQVGHMLMSGDTSYTPDQNYYDVISSYFVEEPMLVDVDEYRAFLMEASHALDEANRNQRDILPKTLAQMNYIIDNIESERLREVLIHDLAAMYVDNFGIDGIQEIENIYNTYVKDSVLVADYGVKYDKWDVSKPGKLSPDFVAYDIDGKEYTLADFKGKYVYIDMWATWCNPCRQEMPHLKDLEKRFEDAEITFLSLSIDRDKSQWEKMVRSGDMTGVQLYIGTGSKFQQAYNIDGIPRFILLDKAGKIISNNMTRPSEQSTVETLEALEGIR